MNAQRRCERMRILSRSRLSSASSLYPTLSTKKSFTHSSTNPIHLQWLHTQFRQSVYSRFFSFSHFSLSGGNSLSSLVCFLFNSHTDTMTRGCIYTNIYLNLVTKRKDHNRIESKQQGKRYPSIYGKKIFSRILYSWHSGTCGTVPMNELTTVFHRWVSGEADDEVASSKLHEDVKSRGG